MRANKWAAAAAIAVGMSLTGAGVAAAQPSEPVTITLSPEQVQHLCEKRLPKSEQRVTKLLERINADANTRGSVAWLKARAEKERAAGREATANLLEEKAERRAGRVDQLTKIKGWVTDFQAKHCGAK
ncbi:hypothetical protein [Alloactinosynnema sp. L-07]|uniref:hypothetical protein n=1 Tax=Alloactinosynnema sp. L-07 TaxID=1653480 RepID=UPI00065EF0F7|nr:hypothetical protein [Alloactinosynnema sp. L-07]CRK60352.1 hypothetical protein [Alloactinosynnema sp. L-07]